jgi:hypothetical protein
MLKALTDQLHTCGIAPARLFAEAHEQRHVSRAFAKPSIWFDSARDANEQEKQMLRFDAGKGRWCSLERRLKVRIAGNALEFYCGPDEGRILFRPDIRPRLIYTSGQTDLITAHKLPFLVRWVAVRGHALAYAATLVGHLAKITALFLNVSSRIIVAGHRDGRVSVFALAPDRLVRILACADETPVTLVRGMRDTADVLAFQGNERGTRLTLFSVNGRVLHTALLEDEQVRDCVSTAFKSGVKKNMIVLLTVTGQIVLLSSRTLRELDRMSLDRSDSVALALFRDKTLVVTHMSGKVALFCIDVKGRLSSGRRSSGSRSSDHLGD